MRSSIWIVVIASLGVASCASTDEDNGPDVCATPLDVDAVADVTVVARDVRISPATGRRAFDAWTFDGTVPGPILRMKRGESGTVKLVNQSPRTASLHFMGMDYGVENDGTMDFPTSVVGRQCAHVYPITANTDGVWPFLSHVEPRFALSRGQYGAIVVPSAEEQPARHEFILFMGQLGIEGEGGGDDDDESGSPFYMTLNGRAFGDPRVLELDGERYISHEDANPRAQVGDLVRWRLVNASPDVFHSFGIHGHNFCDRGGLEVPVKGCPNGGRMTNIVELGPLMTVSIEYTESNPGHWMYHCHLLDHVDEGMMGYYDVTP